MGTPARGLGQRHRSMSGPIPGGGLREAVPFGAVALTAYVRTTTPKARACLERPSFYDPSNFCFPFEPMPACRIDPDTGHVDIVRYVGRGRRAT